jgi:tRNA-modifying protein YgfZ
VVARWGETSSHPSPDEHLLRYADPRHQEMGERLISPLESTPASLSMEPEKAYHMHRVRLGVPEGGMDFVYGDSFPHDANIDQLHGVDFTKGCYVGQEVVSRMYHRGTARTRIVRVRLSEPVDLCPVEPHPIRAGEKPVGTLGTCIHGEALAQVRLDRVQEAKDAGVPLNAGAYDVEIIA